MSTKGVPKRRQVKGEPWVWLSGGAVAFGIVLILGLLGLIFVFGTVAFWPHDIDAFVMGKARYRIHHPQQGQVYVARDDSRLVVEGAGKSWRTLGGAEVPQPAATRKATMADYRKHREVFDGYPDRKLRLRNAKKTLLMAEDGTELTPAMFFENPEKYRPVFERDKADFESRIFIFDGERGELALPDTSDNLLVPVPWRDFDGKPVAFDFPEPRIATVADLRQLPNLFKGLEFVLAGNDGNVVKDADGKPVPASAYVAERERFQSPWGYYDENGRHIPIETMLGDDTWRDHTLLVGSPRGEREMDIRSLPPNADGTPVKPYQLAKSPYEVLVRQGNQGDKMYGDSDYFRWVRADLPDPEAMKRHRLSTYEETILTRAPLPYATLIERLEHGVLTGYVTRVTIEGEVLADIKKDGREKVWAVFLREQERMREHFLKRYELEKDDIGHVNFMLKDLLDEVKRLRYEHRDSRDFIVQSEKMNKAYAEWEALEPLPDVKLSTEQYLAATADWASKLEPMMKDWHKAAMAAGLPAAETEALDEMHRLVLERGRVQAAEFSPLRFEVVQLRQKEKQSTYDFETPDGKVETLPLSEVVRAFRPNEMGLFGKLGVYVDRIGEYLFDDPRESNTEGGIFPVILGTLLMTMLMAVAVVPFGVICALYLREYAKQGTIVSAVRISVNNLAGVPSIVFGIFGLGFFCVMVGGSIDDLFYPELAPAPMFGGGGILWASLTLALLTVPVVIVSTEEALSAVPASQREASLACGASKFQTIWKVILPQALPGVLTGTILAMARGAGEVAPLMLVGAVKYAPYPPVDGITPFIHLERKFMHLGFHVYDVGFQSPNVDNTKPLVFATSLVLIALVATLNVFAISLRNRLRRKFATSAV